MKKISIVLCLLSMFFLASCSEEKAENIKPYQAQTSEECIHEPDCVWFALKPMILNADSKYQEFGRDSKYAKKWISDISIQIIEKKPYRVKDAFETTPSILKNFFPYEISQNQKFNFLIFVSENLEKDIFETQRDFFEKISGTEISEYYSTLGSNEKKCFYMRYFDKKEIKAFLMFVDKNSQINYCLVKNLYAGLSNLGKLNRFNLSGLYNDNKNRGNINNLDLFLLTLFYRLNYKESDTIDDIKQRYLNIFPEALKDFKILRAKVVEEFNGAI